MTNPREEDKHQYSRMVFFFGMADASKSFRGNDARKSENAEDHHDGRGRPVRDSR